MQTARTSDEQLTQPPLLRRSCTCRSSPPSPPASASRALAFGKRLGPRYRALPDLSSSPSNAHDDAFQSVPCVPCFIPICQAFSTSSADSISTSATACCSSRSDDCLMMMAQCLSRIRDSAGRLQRSHVSVIFPEKRSEMPDISSWSMSRGSSFLSRTERPVINLSQIRNEQLPTYTSFYASASPNDRIRVAEYRHAGRRAVVVRVHSQLLKSGRMFPEYRSMMGGYVIGPAFIGAPLCRAHARPARRK